MFRFFSTPLHDAIEAANNINNKIDCTISFYDSNSLKDDDETKMQWDIHKFQKMGI